VSHEEDGRWHFGRIGTGLGVFVSLGAVAVAMTLLFLSMRSVMKIGGTCAEGQTPYVIAHRCPKGVTLLLLAGIWGGLIAAGIYMWQTMRRGVPSLAGLLWPALFLSLGWNFLEFGVNPPGGGGLAWGWLICAVVFLAMGGVPLAFVVPVLVRGSGDPPSQPFRRAMFPPGSFPSSGTDAWTLRRATTTGATTGEARAIDPSAQPVDVVSLLERLAALHRTGALNDQEYGRAKREILERESR
jgi:hypothetical protein